MFTNWLSSNWENLLKAVPIIFGAIVTIKQLKGKIPASRSQLKSDLEILKLLSEEDPSHKLIKDSIDARISQIYTGAASKDPTQTFHVYDWRNLILGIAFLLFFGLWTAYLFAFRGSWWALLTGFFALAGVGNLMSAFDDRKSDRKSASAQDATPEHQSTGKGS